MEAILSRMQEVVDNPNEVIKKFKKETGNKAIGCFPVYCPEEIIHAAGMLPVGIWGGHTELDLAKQYFPAFACSIMQSALEFGLKGAYNELSGVIIPGMCDTLICLGQNWKSAVPQVPYIALVYPQNRKLESGVKYLVNEYKNIKTKLEEICGHEITEEKLQESIEVYNEHRKVMQEFVELSPKYANTIKPSVRNLIIKSGFFMKKEEHTDLVKNLIAELNKKPVEECTGSKVVLTGISLDSKDILDILEENNMTVVGDDLAQETRQFRTLVPDGKEALERLARQWSNIEGCSLAYDPDKKRGSMIVDEVKNKDADGVVFCMMKFCDPEEYDYPVVKSDIEASNIPTLYIEIDQQTSNNEQVRTRVQAFTEMLSLA
ncbi:(R)-2-hydroxyisocaproyl-CoA dehydratase subunit beta [Metaclostridioides mangenotii]|uniref:Bcr-type benzoyl-CoA reductase subunit C n=1 Tax=Metaclostridioides mangenotii TaxID=1540 RepID=A0ABS4E9C7_9FIRM|nr:2-hydroxyacyl-CoA dehydratase family protein [Clostridioides mangenotii]MBP1854549.1 bcr-type benzoyl-CoA reductase subunit C [Clostridioides mangenotii]